MSRLGPITGERELQEGIDFVGRWKGKHPLITPMLAPHASDTVAYEWLKQIREEADRQHVKIHMHLAQSTREQNYIKEQYQKGCVEYLNEMGFLQPDVFTAHCLYIDDRELDILAASGANPIYCPMGHALSGNRAAWELINRAPTS